MDINNLVNGGDTAILRKLLQSSVAPSPLYNGITLLLRHVYGASYSIAVAFKNIVNNCTASSPIHFKHYKGKQLRPVLLLALKCF